MKNLNENKISPIISRGDFTRGIPFYGTKGDFNFTLGRSQFTPGISIKQVPLTDMSVKGDTGFSDLDLLISRLRYFFKAGDRIRGIEMNSQLDGDNVKYLVGKLYKIKPDFSNDMVRVWIQDPKTLKVTEVYVESIARLYESVSNRALTFNQFVNS
jgi:hypothetical protein